MGKRVRLTLKEESLLKKKAKKAGYEVGDSLVNSTGERGVRIRNPQNGKEHEFYDLQEFDEMAEELL